MRRASLGLALASTLLSTLPAAVPALSAQQISNAALLDPGSLVFGFGDPISVTYGEVFTAPGGALNDSRSGSRITTTAVCYSSTPMSAHGMGPNLSGRHFGAMGHTWGRRRLHSVEYTFNTGALAVTPGDTYIAFVSASAFDQANPSVNALQYFGSDASGSLGQHFWYSWSPSISDLYTSSGWDHYTPGDLIFQADFSAQSITPEPSTIALLATGMIGMAGAGFRRKRRI